MFLNPYDTTPCSAYLRNLPNIIGQLERVYLIDGFGLEKIPNDGGYILTPNDTTIPPFGHPLPINVGKRLEYVVDVRPFTRLDSQRNVVISSRLDYKILTERSILQTRCYTEGSKSIFDLGNYPIKAFGQWLSNALRLRYALDPDVVLKVQIAASYYYICMSDDTEEKIYDEQSLSKIKQLLSNIWRVSITDVDGLVAEGRVLQNIQDLISLLQHSCDTKRLERFNQVDLYQTIGGSWFGGGNPRELIAVALEHPPTFVVLVYNAMTEKGYQKSMLGQMLGKADKDNDAKAFSFNYEYMIHGK